MVALHESNSFVLSTPSAHMVLGQLPEREDQRTTKHY